MIKPNLAVDNFNFLRIDEDTQRVEVYMGDFCGKEPVQRYDFRDFTGRACPINIHVPDTREWMEMWKNVQEYMKDRLGIERPTPAIDPEMKPVLFVEDDGEIRIMHRLVHISGGGLRTVEVRRPFSSSSWEIDITLDNLRVITSENEVPHRYLDYDAESQQVTVGKLHGNGIETVAVSALLNTSNYTR